MSALQVQDEQREGVAETDKPRPVLSADVLSILLFLRLFRGVLNIRKLPVDELEEAFQAGIHHPLLADLFFRLLHALVLPRSVPRRLLTESDWPHFLCALLNARLPLLPRHHPVVTDLSKFAAGVAPSSSSSSAQLHHADESAEAAPPNAANSDTEQGRHSSSSRRRRRASSIEHCDDEQQSPCSDDDDRLDDNKTTGSDDDKTIGSDDNKTIGSDDNKTIGSDDNKTIGSDDDQTTGSDDDQTTGSDNEDENNEKDEEKHIERSVLQLFHVAVLESLPVDLLASLFLSLCEWALDEGAKFEAACTSLELDQLRPDALGTDSLGDRYWYFGDDRLYKEDEPPSTPTVVAAPVENTRKKKPAGKTTAKRGRWQHARRSFVSIVAKVDGVRPEFVGQLLPLRNRRRALATPVSAPVDTPSRDAGRLSVASSSSSTRQRAKRARQSDSEPSDEEEEEEEEDNVKTLLTDYSRQRPTLMLVCDTEAEWTALIERLGRSRLRADKQLARRIAEASEQAVRYIRKQVRLREAAAKSLLPRKRSSRIAERELLNEYHVQLQETGADYEYGVRRSTRQAALQRPSYVEPREDGSVDSAPSASSAVELSRAERLALRQERRVQLEQEKVQAELEAMEQEEERRRQEQAAAELAEQQRVKIQLDMRKVALLKEKEQEEKERLRLEREEQKRAKQAQQQAEREERKQAERERKQQEKEARKRERRIEQLLKKEEKRRQRNAEPSYSQEELIARRLLLEQQIQMGLVPTILARTVNSRPKKPLLADQLMAAIASTPAATPAVGATTSAADQAVASTKVVGQTASLSPVDRSTMPPQDDQLNGQRPPVSTDQQAAKDD